MGRARLDGTGVNQRFITGANSMGSIAIAGDYIYWTNLEDVTIGRARLDGSEVDQAYITCTSRAGGIASDGQYLYWSNIDTDTIGRVKLDGTEMNATLISGVANTPVAIAVSGGYIYWGGYTGQMIGRAKLDGTELNASFITCAPEPYMIGPAGLAIAGGCAARRPLDPRRARWHTLRQPDGSAVTRASPRRSPGPR